MASGVGPFDNPYPPLLTVSLGVGHVEVFPLCTGLHIRSVPGQTLLAEIIDSVGLYGLLQTGKKHINLHGPFDWETCPA